MRRATWMLAALALLFGGPGRAKADFLLDQHFEPGPTAPSFTLGVSGNTFAQTFTVGVAGNLAEIDVDVFRRFATDNLTLNLRGTTNGVPNGTILATETVSFASLPAGRSWAVFDHQSLNVTAGEVLAIDLQTGQASSAGDWYFERGSPYAGGKGYHSTGSAWTDESVDFGFRTFVETPSAVPEPSSLTLLGTAVATALGYVGWRRRKHAKPDR